MKLIICVLVSTVFTVTLCDVTHILNNEKYAEENFETTTTPQPPPRPYYFSYAAGRAPGHLDRTHSEGSDGSGVVQGTYSYVDPRFRLRVVEYVADKNGFYPILNYTPKPVPDDSPVVEAAKQKHYALYAKIANSHAQGLESLSSATPRESEAVIRATNKHYNLYNQIAAEHARIAEERAAILATAEPNTLEQATEVY